jgi:hypothetical protein
MSNDRVFYNGHWMSADWPPEIEAAQLVTHYVINSERYPRVRYGDESDDWGADRQPCHDCGVVQGQFHVGVACDVEECPRCGGQVISCDCEYAGDEAK